MEFEAHNPPFFTVGDGFPVPPKMQRIFGFFEGKYRLSPNGDVILFQSHRDGKPVPYDNIVV
jgi:hypothetical protein